MLVTSWEMLAKREGRASIVLEMLTFRFGTLSLRLRNQISRLTSDELGELALATYKFAEVKQLRDWLAKHKSPPVKNGNSKTHQPGSAKRRKMMSLK